MGAKPATAILLTRLRNEIYNTQDTQPLKITGMFKRGLESNNPYELCSLVIGKLFSQSVNEPACVALACLGWCWSIHDAPVLVCDYAL